MLVRLQGMLKDTLLYYLDKNINWNKINKTNCDCSDSFIISYYKTGDIKKVELIKYANESDNIWYKIYEWKYDKKCSRRIKKAIQSLSLDYLEAPWDFNIEVEFYYNKFLEIRECRHYFPPVSDIEIEEYVKKQMNVKE